MISWVISAWRARFISRVRSSIKRSGVLGGVAHRGHARAVLGRGRLEQRAVHRDLDVLRHEPAEDLGGVGLVLDERVVTALVGLRAVVVLFVAALEDRRLLQRQQGLAADLLDQRGDVAVVEDVDAVDLAVHERRGEVVGDLAGVGVGGAVGEADVLPRRLALAEGQRRHAAAARRVHRDRAALALVLDRRAQAGADDLRVERAGQAAVAGDQQDRHLVLGLVLLEDGQAGDLGARGLGGLPGHAPDRARVGPQRLDALLGPAQARRGDHLHRPGDLLDVLDRPDAVLDVPLASHQAGAASRSDADSSPSSSLSASPSSSPDAEALLPFSDSSLPPLPSLEPRTSSALSSSIGAPSSSRS